MDQREPHQAITATAAAEQPPFRYDARLANEIEARWQRRWAERGTFDSPNPAGPLAAGFSKMAGRPKFYVLDMFPYPSGAGLHVGHPLGYIGTDVFARYLRMTGHHVLHTFGYDAFGLPAEQYAIETGQHPQVTTGENIANMRRQLRRLGLGHDPRREVATTDASYYRWTQWIFLQLFNSWVDERTGEARPIADLIAEFEAGTRVTPGGRAWRDLTEAERHEVLAGRRLAYQATETVNWCPGLGTVLANEEVTADGRSDIGNYPVYRRPLRQWMLRITAFADRLVADLDLVDWPEPIKQMQRNWIGASDGASIEFPVSGRPGLRIEVFTTRPDTVTGATYLVLAPEHPLAGELVAPAWPAGTPVPWRNPGGGDGAADRTPAEAVAAYQEKAARLSDRQRTEASAKTGVFTGSYVDNPATGERLPVFLADYVLTGYGTGAIMAVPAHDQRDLDFARQFGLPVRAVLVPPPDWLTGHGIDAGTPAERGRAQAGGGRRPGAGAGRGRAQAGGGRRPGAGAERGGGKNRARGREKQSAGRRRSAGTASTWPGRGRNWPGWPSPPRSRPLSPGWRRAARATPPGPTGCATGCSPGSGTGASPSPSCTTSAGWPSRCPRTRCRSACRN
jgi:leucyl-tRNA synthetase